MTAFVLPAELQARALQLRGSGDAARWEMGDLVADVVTEFPNGTRTQATKALADLLGIGYSTARKYSRVAQVFDGAHRDEFAALTFDALYECAAHDDPHGLARWAVESADEWGGKPAPVDRIRAKRKELQQGEVIGQREQYAQALDRAFAALSRAGDLALALGLSDAKRIGDMLAQLEGMQA